MGGLNSQQKISRLGTVPAPHRVRYKQGVDVRPTDRPGRM